MFAENRTHWRRWHWPSCHKLLGCGRALQQSSGQWRTRGHSRCEASRYVTGCQCAGARVVTRAFCAVAARGGGHARERVGEEARGAEVAEAAGVSHGGVRIRVLARDVREAGGVALPGGAARLVARVVIVVLLDPVQGSRPGDVGGRGVRQQRGGVRVVPRPLLLDVTKPGAHVVGRAPGGGVGRARAREERAAQVQHAVCGDAELEAVPDDVVLVQRERGVLCRIGYASEDRVLGRPEALRCGRGPRRAEEGGRTDGLAGVSTERAVA